MVQIQNTEAITAIRDGARLSISEGFPQNLLPNVQPVMDMTPRFHKEAISSIISSNGSGVITAYTGNAGKRFYITGAVLSVMKDAACDAASGVIQINYTQGGVSKSLLAIAHLTATAMYQTIDTDLVYAIPIDLGTNITVTGTFAAGTMSRSAIIYGYEIPVS